MPSACRKSRCCPRCPLAARTARGPASAAWCATPSTWPTCRHSLAATARCALQATSRLVRSWWHWNGQSGSTK
jgi:hypothetical protein